jgi:hypothetical protein
VPLSKGRSVHENFKFMHSSAKLLHVRRKPTIIFKVDLSKASDLVKWAFLLEILHLLGFLNAWLNWVAEILRSASTTVQLNGAPGQRICHAWGLYQGAPPLLFILVMEVLGAMFRKADGCELLQSMAVDKSSIVYLYMQMILLCSSPRSPLIIA